MKKIDRLEFLYLAGGILGAGLAATAAACGGDDAAGASGAACDSNAPRASFTMNHGHELALTASDATKAIGKGYPTSGMATHTHNVPLQTSDFQKLEAGGTVIVAADPAPDGHTHTVTIVCG